MATEWLIRHAELDPSAAGEQGMLLVLAENLAAMNEHEVLVNEFIKHPLEDQIGFVRALVSSDHPDRSAMLTTISTQHPAPEVAAAARTAIAAGDGRSLRIVTGTPPHH